MVAALTTPLDWTGGPALIWVLGAAALYLLGGRGRRAPRAGDRWRAASFFAGLAAILAALDSPLDELAEELFWAHMVQHVLLIGVAPPLLALARPWPRMWRGVPAGLRRPVSRALTSSPRWSPLRRLAAFLGGGLVSWLIFNLDFCAWHLPVLYDAALRSAALHAVEHLAFFATALLFWTRVIYSPPWRSRLGEPAKLAYLGATMVVGWVLAIVLALAYLVKLWRRLVPGLAPARELPRLGYRSVLDRLAEVGWARRRGESREGFARRLTAAVPSLEELTARHLGAALGSRRSGLDPESWRRLRRAVGSEVRSSRPGWRRALGLLDPLAWWRVR